MNDEKLLELQELFIKRLTELFPYKNGGKHKDFSRLDELNLSTEDRKHITMSANAIFKARRIAPIRSLTLIGPLFSNDEFKLFKEAYNYQIDKAKVIRNERAKTIHAYRKTIGRSPEPFSGGIDKESLITTADGEEVKIIKQLESGNYIVEFDNEKRLLGRDDMKLAKAKYVDLV